MRYKECANCPFFDPNQLHLSRERKLEIVASIRSDASFHCHATLDYNTEDDDPMPTARTQECVGSMILQEREGRVNQMLRIMERIGMYDHTKLDMASVPYPTFDDWINADSVVTHEL